MVTCLDVDDGAMCSALALAQWRDAVQSSGARGGGRPCLRVVNVEAGSDVAAMVWGQILQHNQTRRNRAEAPMGAPETLRCGSLREAVLHLRSASPPDHPVDIVLSQAFWARMQALATMPACNLWLVHRCLRRERVTDVSALCVPSAATFFVAGTLLSLFTEILVIKHTHHLSLSNCPVNCAHPRD